ncbi:PREDICTED: LOW QUALITY PROTEIN: tenascin-X-like [Ficedula albicollis]|uniref:LOW QUALITY PROTEIN: tenascin-X-like n=1 Tax=Ficedula albicollis TaxID=59894 RepID=UPI0007AD7B7E|nr:PREDICTED: LOW QUALITY PROTEIN: tenascin-X-like [Ficedula albicollis]
MSPWMSLHPHAMCLCVLAVPTGVPVSPHVLPTAVPVFLHNVPVPPWLPLGIPMSPFSPRTMPVTLELRLLLLALALRGEAVSPSVSPSVSPAASPPEPPSETCGAALADVLRRLRELEGHVQALRGHCGDTGGPQAGTAPPPPCPRGCSDQGRCERGRCRCFPGFSGPDCATPACAPGWGGARCDIEVPWVTPRLASRTPTSLRITWPQPLVPPDGYRVTLVPLDDPVAMTTHELPSSAVAFSVTGLSPGRPFELLVQARRGPHLGAPGVLRLRTALIPPVPHYEGSPESPQGSLGSPAVAPSARGPPESPGSPGLLGSPGSPVSPISPDLSLGSPTSLGSPASPKVPASPVARGSLGSPAASRSSVSPEYPESPASPEFPGSSVSPDFSVSPVSPESPVFPGSTPPSWSPVSPLSPGIPSLQDLVARLSTYSGSLLQRLESHLRATNYPLRGNQTVPGVARAILAYILRRHPALGRVQGSTGESGNQEPVPEWGDMDGVKLTEPWRDVGKTAAEEPEELPLPSEEQKHEKLQTETPPSDALPVQAVLGELRVSSISPSSLQWSVPKGSFDSFTLQYRDAQGQPQALPIDGGSRSVTVPGLSPSHRYRFHLYGLRGRKKVDHVSTEVMTAPAEPELPLPPGKSQHEKHQTESPASEAPLLRAVLGELKVSSVTPDSVQLQWSVPEGSFDSFTLQYRDAQGQPQALPIDGGSRSVTVPGLSPSHRYRFHLYGLRGRKKIDHVSTETVTGTEEPEELPLPSEEQKHPKLHTETPPSDAPPVPVVLGELKVSSVTPDSVQLQWTVPGGSFDSFTLQYRDAQGQPQALPIDGGSRSVTVPGLSPSHRYRFHLYGLRGRKKIDHVSIDIITAAEEPEELPLPTEEPQHEKPQTEAPTSEAAPVQAVLEDLRPKGSFDSFTLQYRDAQGQPQALPIDGGSRSVTVPGLSPSHRYRFHLYGLRGRKKIDHVSTEVMTASEEPLASEEPKQEKPQTESHVSEALPARAVLGELKVLEDLRVSSVTPDSVQLQWSVPKGSFDSFTLQYRDAQGQPQALPIDGGSRSVTVPGLSPSHRYRFHLYGLRGGKRIDHVSTDTVTATEEHLPSEEPKWEKPKTKSHVSEAPPVRPVLGELKVSSVTPSSVGLQWSVPEGSFDSFMLQYRDAQGHPQALPIDGGSHSVTVPGLSPSHQYRFHLYGLRGRKKINHVSTEVLTAAEEPEELPLPTEEPQHEKPQTEAPTSEAAPVQAVLEDLRVSSVTPDSVQLQWSVPKGSFDSFTLQYRDAQGQPQALPIDGGSRSVTVPGLSPSHRYRFHLYGLRGGKRIDRISTDTVTGEAESQEGCKDTEMEAPMVPIPMPTSEQPLTQHHLLNHQPFQQTVDWDLLSSIIHHPPSSISSSSNPSIIHCHPLSSSTVYHHHQHPSVIIHPSILPYFPPHLSLKDGFNDGSREEPLASEVPQQEKPKTESTATEALPARAVLGELKVSSVTPHSVQLQWSVPEGSFDSFTLQYRDAQGQPQALPIDGASRSVTVPGLSPSHRYRFHLCGLRGGKRIDRVSTDAVTAAEEPEELPLTTEEPQHEKPQTEAPTSEAAPVQAVLEDLRVSSVTPDSVQLQWSVPKGSFDSFLLQYRDAQGQPQALPIDGGSRSVTVPGLSPSHRYRFHLYGLRGRKKIDHVSTEVMTAKEEGAEEPEELPLPTKEPQHEKPQTEAPTSEAAPVQAVLEDLRVSSVTPDSHHVPEGSFDSFLLQYRDAQGQPQALPIDGGSRLVTVPGLSPSHRYRFHLYGLRGRKKIDHFSSEVMTAKEEGGVDVWMKYNAYVETWRDQGMDESYRDAQGQPQALPIDGGSRLVTVPGLSPSHRYRFHLYGLRGRKKIDHFSSEVMTAKEEAAEEPEELPLTTEEPQHEKPQTEAPTSEAAPVQAVLEDLRVSSVTPDSVQLQWSVPKGSFDSFTLQYRDAQGQPQALPIDGGSRSVTVPGLSPSHRYRFHLYGLRGRKKIDHVSTEVMTAAEEPEELPLTTEEPQHEKPQTEAPTSEAAPVQAVLEDLRVSSVTPDSVQLQWSVPKGSFDSFTLQYRDAQGQPQALPIDGGSRSVTVPGLSPSHRYRFHLYGLRGRKKIYHVSTEVMTAAEEPEELPLTTEEPQHEKPQTEAPTSEAAPVQAVLEDLRVSSVTPDSVQLQWSVPKGSFDSFTLQYRDAQGQPQALPIDGGSCSVTVPGLSPSHRYRFHLYGLRGGKRIDRVSTDTVTGTEEPEELPLPSEEQKHPKLHTETPPSDAPPVPVVLGELRVSSVTPDSVQLQWSVPKGSFDSFTLQYRDAQGQPQALPIDGGSRSVTVPGLSPSHRYRFHLYGLRGGKRTDRVSTDTVTASEKHLPSEERHPEKPKTESPASEALPARAVLGELKVSSVTPESVQLQWTPVLEDLRVSSVTPDSVQLQWSVPKGSFDSFTLQYRDAQGQPQALPIDGRSRLVTVPGLSPSHRYRFHLYGLRGRKKIDHVSTEVMTAAEEPEELPLPTEEPQHEKPQTEAPTSEAAPVQAVLEDLRVSSVTPDSVQLQWSVPKGSFDSFTLQYRDAQGQPQALPIDGGSRSVTVPGLSPSHRYRFHLYGLRGGKRIDRVSTDTVTASEEPLPLEEPQEEKLRTESPASEALPARAVLGELKVSSVTPNSVQLKWSVPEGSFDSFTLQYRDAQGQPQALPIDGESRSVMVPGLSPSYRYHFHIYGLRGRKRIDHVSTKVLTGKGEADPEDLPSPSMDPTNEASTITTEAPIAEDHKPEHPRTEAPLARAVLGELKVSSVTPNSVQLQWTVPRGSFDSFLLQYRDAQGQPQALPIDGGSRSVTVPGLSPSHRYRFHLYGMHRGKRIGHVSIDAITALSLSGIMQSAINPSTDLLNNTRHQSIIIIIHHDDSSSSIIINYPSATDKPEEPPSPSEEPSPTSEKPQSEAPPTEDQLEQLQTELPPVRAVLEDLRVTSVTPDSVQLQWSVPKGSFDSFTLQYRDAQGQPQALPIDGGSRSVTVPGLSPSHRYRFHLYGLRGGKRTDRVSTDIVTAAAKPEELPLPSEEPETEAISSDALPAQAVLEDLRVSSVTPDSVQLQWSVPKGSFDSFTLQYRDAQGQPQALPIDGGSRSVTVPGLSPSHRYRFHLYGLQGGKRTDRVSTDVTTDAAVPEQLPLPSVEPQPEEHKPEQPQTEQPQTEQPQTEADQGQVVLGKLRVTSVTPDSVQLQWSVPKGSFDSFTLQYRDAQGQPQALPIDGGSRSVTVPGLSPSHRYRFHLYGLRGRKRTDRVSTDVVTADPEDLPSPSMDPTNEAPTAEVHQTAHPQAEAPPSEAPLARAVLGELKVSSVTPNSVQLQWTVPRGSFDSFLLQYRDAQGQPQALPIDGGSRSVTVPGLSPSHRYRFHLYGLRGGKRIDHVSTEATTGAPGTLWVGSVWPRSAWLHWDSPHAPPDGYELQYGPPGGAQQTLWLPPEATSQQLWGLEPAGRYEARLWGRGGDPQTAPLEATFGTPPLPHPHPRDCAEEQLNGPGPSRETLIFLRGDPARPLRVFCDMETDGGGWLVGLGALGRCWGQLPQGFIGGYMEFWREMTFWREMRGLGATGGPAGAAGGHGERHSTNLKNGEFEESQLLRQQRGVLGGTPELGGSPGVRGGTRGIQGRPSISGGVLQELGGTRELEGTPQEFWGVPNDFLGAGNEALHELTAATPTELRIDLRTARDSAFAIYRDFAVGSAGERYRLRVGAFSGTAGDALSYHSGSPFSTRERDPPPTCHYANLNGLYGTPRDHQGIHWFPWKGFNVSIPFTEMKLRPQHRG